MGYRVVLAKATDSVYLIFHQRDEWADHQRAAVEHERRKLIAQALAPARRHDDKGVAALENREADILLFLFEFIEPEVVLEGLVKTFASGDHSLGWCNGRKKDEGWVAYNL